VKVGRQNHQDYPLVIGVENVRLTHFLWKIQFKLHLNLVNQHYVKYTYATTAARKLNIGNISKGPSLPEFFLCFTSIAGIVI
jgi:hypothetical protein